MKTTKGTSFFSGMKTGTEIRALDQKDLLIFTRNNSDAKITFPNGDSYEMAIAILEGAISAFNAGLAATRRKLVLRRVVTRDSNKNEGLEGIDFCGSFIELRDASRKRGWAAIKEYIFTYEEG